MHISWKQYEYFIWIFIFSFHLSVGAFFYVVFPLVSFCGFVYLLLLFTVSLLAAGHLANYLNVPCAQKPKYINTSTSLTSTEQTEFAVSKIYTVSHSKYSYLNATWARNGLQMRLTKIVLDVCSSDIHILMFSSLEYICKPLFSCHYTVVITRACALLAAPFLLFFSLFDLISEYSLFSTFDLVLMTYAPVVQVHCNVCNENVKMRTMEKQ